MQRFSHRSESSEPHIKLPSVGVQHQGDEALEHLALKGLAGLNCRSPTGLGETETPLSEGTHKISHASGPRAKQQFDRSLGRTTYWSGPGSYLLERWGVS